VQILVADVYVPEGRFRQIDKKVEEIAQSILMFGQLQPIIVTINSDGKRDEAYELVDGLHRLTAMQINGELYIEAMYLEDLDDLTKRKIELEVNIQRVDMSWQERTHAIATLHKLELEENPDTDQGSTATKIGVHQRDVSNALKLQASRTSPTSPSIELSSWPLPPEKGIPESSSCCPGASPTITTLAVLGPLWIKFTGYVRFHFLECVRPALRT